MDGGCDSIRNLDLTQNLIAAQYDAVRCSTVQTGFSLIATTATQSRIAIYYGSCRELLNKSLKSEIFTYQAYVTKETGSR